LFEAIHQTNIKQTSQFQDIMWFRSLNGILEPFVAGSYKPENNMSNDIINFMECFN